MAEQGFDRSEAVRRRAGGVGKPARRPRTSVVQEAGRPVGTLDWRGSSMARFI